MMRSWRGMLATPQWQLPVLSEDDRFIGGVAAALAREVGVDPLWIRLSFVALFASGGWGGLLYLVAWGGLSAAAYLGHVPPGPPAVKGRTRRHRLLGVGLVVFGFVMLAAQLTGIRSSLLWPLGLLAAGILISLRRITPRSDTSLPSWFPGSQILGVVVAAAGGIAVVGTLGFGFGSPVAITLGGALVGLTALSAPWWWRLVSDLDAERQARVRSEERAEVAAHLHDSVLQTLALIQKGEDPQHMVHLARRQERELRNWLDPDRASRSGGSLRGQLDEMASTVEELHGVTVEVVVVGDVLIDGSIEPLLGATREAVVNAAKHAGSPQVDVYAEVHDDAVEIFVRDTGKGFDLGAIGDDRRGLRESMTRRMERAGGSVAIHSSLGEGTEIELRMPRGRGGSE